MNIKLEPVKNLMSSYVDYIDYMDGTTKTMLEAHHEIFSNLKKKKILIKANHIL